MTTQNKNKPLFGEGLIAPVLTIICLATMLLLNWLWPIAHIFHPPINLGGLLLLGTGLGITILAKSQFQRVHTNLHPFKDPNHLVTDGLFSYTRNPMYLGLTIFLAGAWASLGSLSPLVIVVAFFLIADRWYVAYEEHRLAQIFGKSYEIYQTRTSRWI